MTIMDAIKKGMIELKNSNIESPKLKSRLLMQYVLKQTRQYIIVNDLNQISKEDEERYFVGISKLRAGVPLEHITHQREFMKLNFYINENVLIPRQDTEILVEEVMKLTNSESRVLDMCTGSGCIIISLAASGHTSENGAVAIDISDDALKVADYNKKYNNADYIKLIKSDMFSSSECEQYKNEDNRFDVIVSNPPYIPTKDIDELSEEVRLHDPVLALDGDTDGLKFYKAITKQSVNYLKENGYLCYEIGYNQAEDVRNIMEQCGYSGIKVIKDLAGLDRVVIGRLNNIN